MTTLREIFETHTGRYSVKRDPYLDIYPRHLSKFIGTNATLIEFGVLQGGSLQIWRKWLGPNVRIIGVDRAPECTSIDVGETVIIGDQTDPRVLSSLPSPDIIIDDAGHIASSMIATFDIMWPRLRAGGVYAVEDIMPHNRSFLEYARQRIVTDGGDPKALVAEEGLAISYREITLFEKNPVAWRKVRASARA